MALSRHQRHDLATVALAEQSRHSSTARLTAVRECIIAAALVLVGMSATINARYTSSRCSDKSGSDRALKMIVRCGSSIRSDGGLFLHQELEETSD